MRRLAPLLPYFRRRPWALVLGLLSILGAVVLGLAAPLVVGRGIDSLRHEVSARSLLTYAAVLLGITAVQGIFNYAQRMILVTLSRDIELDLRDDYFAHLETLPLGYYQKSYTGDLMARATNDLQAVRMLCGPAIMYSANTLFAATGALLLMARIDGTLTLLALFTLPFVAWVTRLFGERIYRHFQDVQARFSDVSTRVQESFSGVRVVRAYAQEAAEEAEFARMNAAYVESNRRLARWSSAFHPLLQALIGLGFVVVLGYGGRQILAGRITVGEFVTFNMFLAKLVWPMIAIGWVSNLVQRGTASMDRIREVLDIRPAIRDEVPAKAPVAGAIDGAVPGAISGAIEYRDLTFAYEPDRPVLRDVSFAVPAGTRIAVVGRTGSGKSTLLSLLPRLFDPPPGAVLVDGVDVRARPLAELRGAIAMVPQESFLFSATIGENIGLGRPGAAREEIVEAARLAGLVEDLERFPQGLDTMVGERGITLSGGQKQRVALARALLRRPRILLLDDCLSAVDTATEERILGNLRTVFVGRTVLLVSHRISAVHDADLILVLDDGRVVERGTHEELRARGGLYAELEQRQMLEAELAAV